MASQKDQILADGRSKVFSEKITAGNLKGLVSKGMTAMNTEQCQTILNRYTTPQFKTDPFGSLALAMGLDRSKIALLRIHEHAVMPILCGIALYRHLNERRQAEVLHAIRQDIPRSRLTSILQGLVLDTTHNHTAYAWSLSDEELRVQLTEAKGVTDTLDALGVASVGSVSLTSMAAGLYDAVKLGPKKHALKLLTDAPRVTAVAEKLGFTAVRARAVGIASVVALAAMAFVRMNAAATQRKAEQETALRNLYLLEE